MSTDTMSKLFFIFLIQLFICSTLPHELPSYIPLCKRNDPDLSKCFINSVNTIRPFLIKAIPEMELPPGDPLPFHDIQGSTNFGGVQLKGHVWNQTVYGLMDFDFKRIDIDFDNATCNVNVFFPKLHFDGQYRLTGKILSVEIDSTGDFHLNTSNLNASAEITGRYYTQKSKQYLEFYRIDWKLDIKETKVRFDDLVKGNPELTMTLNDAINKNMEGILSDLRPAIEETFTAVAEFYFNTVFRLFPVDILFPLE